MNIKIENIELLKQGKVSEAKANGSAAAVLIEAGRCQLQSNVECCMSNIKADEIKGIGELLEGNLVQLRTLHIGCLCKNLTV